MKVFFDTNVLLDVLLQREPFYQESARAWTLAELGKITGFVSVISYTTAFYVVRRLKKTEGAKKAILGVRDIFTTVGCDVQTVNQAIAADFKDFEDGVQYVSALHIGAECLLTRNRDHFPDTADCTILTPSEFLANYSHE